MGGKGKGGKGKGGGGGKGKGKGKGKGGRKKEMTMQRELRNVVGNVMSDAGEDTSRSRKKSKGKNGEAQPAFRPSRRQERKNKRKEAKQRRSFFFEGGRRHIQGKETSPKLQPATAPTAAGKGGKRGAAKAAAAPPAKRQKKQPKGRGRRDDDDEEITSEEEGGDPEDQKAKKPGAGAKGDDGSSDEGGEDADAADMEGEEEEDAEEEEEEADAAGEEQSGDDAPEAPRKSQAAAAPAGGAYLPPHLRGKLAAAGAGAGRAAAQAGGAAEYRRTLRGIMNRVSEGNIDPSSKEMADVLRKMIPDVGSTTAADALISVLLPAAVGDPNISVLVLGCHAALAVAAHVAYGAAFGAAALLQVGTMLQKRLAAAEEFDETESTSFDARVAKNCIVMLALLFSFGMLPGNVVFDLVRFVLKGGLSSEVRVELSLTILRYAGRTLRADYASDFKEVLQVVNTAAQASHNSDSAGEGLQIRTRVDYLLRELQDLKNNKVSFAVMDRFDMTRNWLVKAPILGMRKISDHQLGVPFRFLQEDPPKGWPIEAALEGVRVGPKKRSTLSGPTAVDALRATAVAQRLSTDLRQSLFVALMGAQDFEHAAERLLLVAQTAKAGVDEACLVIFHCAIREKAPNPFYEHVADALSAKPQPYGKRFVHSFKRAAVQNLSQAHGFGLRAAVCLAELCAALIAMQGVNLPLAMVRFMKFDTAGEGGSKGLGGVLGILLRHMMESLLRRLPDGAAVPEVFAPIKKYDDVREGMLLVLDGLVKPRMPNNKSDPALWDKFRVARREVSSRAAFTE